MLDIKDLLYKWRISIFILATGFLIPDLEAAKDWSVHKVKAKDTDELTIRCPVGFDIIIVYGEYGNKHSNCSDVFNQYSLALKCNYKQVCHFPQVDDGMKTSCPEGVKKRLTLHYYCRLGQNKLHFTELTQKDKEYNIVCPVNTEIYIVNATLSDEQDRCIIDATEDVKYSCWNHECTFFEIFKVIRDDCSEVNKKLLIMYICDVVEQQIAYAVKDRPQQIKCPHNYMIDILHANYSDPIHDCKPNKVDTHIKERCSSRQRCTVKRTTFSDFPNGCQSDLTELKIIYRCVQSKETRKFTVLENGLVDLSCFHNNVIKIIHASFGMKKKGCRSEEAMERMTKACDGKTKCCGTANTNFLGQSTCLEENSQKLTVTYECIRINDLRIFEKEKDECQHIRFKVSTSFGDITSESFKQMDENLVLMIGTSLPRLQKLSMETYEGVVEYMKDIPSLEVMPNSVEERNDSYVSAAEGLTDMISRTASKYEAIVWFNNFINNSQIINDAHIDILFLAEVMTETGVYVSSLQSLFYDKIKKVTGEVDISVLRFPDIESPYFLVYHIKIIAWRVSDRLLLYEKTSGGLVGFFKSIKFRPNNEYLTSLEPDIIESAKAEAENIFD